MITTITHLALALMLAITVRIFRITSRRSTGTPANHVTMIIVYTVIISIMMRIAILI